MKYDLDGISHCSEGGNYSDLFTCQREELYNYEDVR